MKGEIIGQRLRVVDSSNRSCIGISGTVVDETKGLFIIEIPDGTLKRLIKRQHTFEVCNGVRCVNVSGKDLEQRSEERVK